MRGPLAWIVAIVAGIVLVVVVTAMIGDNDDSGETVSAGEWAQNVCGAIGVWRGEMEDIVEDVRQAPATGAGAEEPQSQTPQGSAGLVRAALERSVFATDTLVTGIDRAGAPDTEQGDAAAQQIASWAAGASETLDSAEATLEKEASTLEEAVAQLIGAVDALRIVLAGGAETLADVAQLDPELTTAVRESSTCQQLSHAQASQ